MTYCPCDNCFDDGLYCDECKRMERYIESGRKEFYGEWIGYVKEEQESPYLVREELRRYFNI